MPARINHVGKHRGGVHSGRDNPTRTGLRPRGEYGRPGIPWLYRQISREHIHVELGLRQIIRGHRHLRQHFPNDQWSCPVSYAFSLRAVTRVTTQSQPATLPWASRGLPFRRTRRRHRAAAVSSAGCLPEPKPNRTVHSRVRPGLARPPRRVPSGPSVILVTRSGTVCTLACCATEISTISGVRAWATVARTCGDSTTPRASWANGVSTISRWAPGVRPNTASSVGAVCPPSVAHTWPRPFHAELSAGCQGSGASSPLSAQTCQAREVEERVLRKAGAVVGETRRLWGRGSWRSPGEAEHTQQRSAYDRPAGALWRRDMTALWQNAGMLSRDLLSGRQRRSM